MPANKRQEVDAPQYPQPATSNHRADMVRFPSPYSAQTPAAPIAANTALK
jgi:hypothetical protein